MAETQPYKFVRSKRMQIARACEWCRVHRIKCDNNNPCSNCSIKCIECSRQAPREVRTLPHALREIERLKLRIRDLELQIETHECTSGSRNTLTPPDDSILDRPLLVRNEDASPSTPKSNRVWRGVFVSTGNSDRPQYYGPTSFIYFIHRLSEHLDSAFPDTYSHRDLEPNSASRSFAALPQALDGQEGQEPASLSAATSRDSSGGAEKEANLTSVQEDYFLGLFWRSYNYTYQVLDEAEFREHYRSLWTAGPSAPRKPSALVDIVLALSMQYGTAFLQRNPSTTSSSPEEVTLNDATIAGRAHYRRSRALLAADLESPSLATLQSDIFAVVYLCNASFQNTAHTLLARAVRTAQVLGLHLEPALELPRPRRELLKRAWWTLCAIEVKTCVKVGRPLSVQAEDVSCTLPADDHALALGCGSSSFVSVGNNREQGEGEVTNLSFALWHARLFQAVGVAYADFCGRCNDDTAVDSRGESRIYADHEHLEACATFVQARIAASLLRWKNDLPSALKTRRVGAGEPFSTDRSPLAVEAFAPSWLQLQRVVLELLYHNSCMNLYRPFITFTTKNNNTSDASSRAALAPTAMFLARMSLAHARAATHAMHQLFVDSPPQSQSLLDGCHEAYQWQWNAALTLLGFLFAYPLLSSSSATATATVASSMQDDGQDGGGEDREMRGAREAVEMAAQVFERLGMCFAQAASAARITRHLAGKADAFVERARRDREEEERRRRKGVAVDDGAVANGGTGGYMGYGSDGGFGDAEEGVVAQDCLSDFLDLAFNVDAALGMTRFADGAGADFWMQGFS